MWGDSSYSKTTLPPGLSNVAQVAASQYSSHAIKDDGGGVMWGMLTYPVGLSNVISLNAAPYHSSVVLFSDGTLTVSQNYTNTRVTSVSCSSSYGMGLKIDGKVFVWGITDDTPWDLGHVVEVAAGLNHRLALRSDGIVVAWGNNSFGQLNIPPGLNDVVAITAGRFHSVAVKSDGTLVSWGDPLYTNLPPGLTNIVAVEAGESYNLFRHVPGSGPPRSFTRTPAPVTTTTAMLNGTVVPNNHHTVAWFEWGDTPAYGNASPLQNAGAWVTNSQVSFTVSNLVAGTAYHFRIVSSNAAGIAYGANQLFRTGSKVSAWGFNEYQQVTIPPGLSNVVAVSSGPNSSCALRADGTVVSWGRNEYGQTNAPGLTNIIAIDSGHGHNLALKQDGTLNAWGLNNFGQSSIPVGLSNVIAIAAGDTHNLALKSDGSVVAWGSNTYGQTNQVAGLNHVVAIAAGGTHNLALRSDGTVVVWGGNYNGQLSIPAGLSNVIAIAAGQSHSLALKRDGTVVAWGSNFDNQCSVPVELSNVVSIAAAQWHSLAVRADGSVVWWGRNNFGQTTPPTDLEFCAGLAGGLNHTLALANRPPAAIPQNLPVLFNQDTELTLIGTDFNSDQIGFKITSLPTAGSLYQFTPNGRGPAITTPNTFVSDPSGRIFFSPETNAVGTPYSSFGFVAHDADSDSVPALITIGISIAKPYAIAQTTTPLSNSAQTFNGVVTPNNSPTVTWFEWGETVSYGQASAPLEVGAGVSPIRVTFAANNLAPGANFHGRLVASNAIGLTIGADFIFTTGEKVSAWGSSSSVLRIPPGVSNTVALAVGDWHALALKANGTVTAWGNSPSGQTNTPAGLTNVIAIASGQLHNLALRSDGTVVGWGLNQSGQTTPPAGLSDVIAIAAGVSNSFALKTDGEVVAWGQNAFGETDIPPGLNGVVAITCGRHHVVALRYDGSLLTWGHTGYGLTNIPPSATNIVAIAAGDFHSLALRSDGKVIAWGENSSQQSTVPASLSNVVAIAGCGYYMNLALKSDGTMATWGSFTPLPTWTNVAGIAGEGSHNLALANLPPVAAPKTVTVPANFDSVITFSGTDTNSDFLTFKINSFPTNGTLYQFTTNGRGPQILLSGTAITDSLGRVLYAPVSNIFGAPLDAFTFAANDGDADSASASIQVNVIATAPMAHTQPSTRISTHSVQLHGMILSGNFPGRSWFEWSTNASFDSHTAIQETPFSPGVVRISATLTNLSPFLTYRFRLVASNALGLVYGAENWFTTGQRVTAWGLSSLGQTTIPPGLSNIVAVQAGNFHSLALRSDGTLASWGDPHFAAPPFSNLLAIASGAFHGLALTTNGTVVSWGQTFQIPVPSGLNNVIAIAAGNGHSVALKADGRVAVWGSNENGQTNIPNLSNIVAIAAGGRHSLALRADGQVFAWGDNFYGQCNVPSTLSNVVRIAAGDGFSLAVRSNGTTVSWPPLPLPPTTNVIAITAGEGHGLVLRADGSLVTWGDNTYGQRNVPGGLSNIVHIATGLRHNLALGNVRPVVLPRTFSGAANSDLLITLSGSDTNSDALVFRLNTIPDGGKLYQYAAGQRGPQLTNGASIADPQRRLLFAPPANAYGSPFTNFSYHAHDGLVNSTSAIVTLHISAPINPTITQFQRTSNGVTSLNFSGHSNTTYCVWASSNLNTWEYLGLPSQPTDGVFQFLDSISTNHPQRFYRISTGCGTPPPQLKSGSTVSGAGFDLRFSGGPYWTYRVWASTDLLNWEMIGTAEESQPGQFRYLDAGATNWPLRFYKAGAP